MLEFLPQPQLEISPIYDIIFPGNSADVADDDSPGGRGDVHGDINPGETSAYNEDGLLQNNILVNIARLIYPEEISGIVGMDSLTPVMMMRSATVSCLLPDFRHLRVTFQFEYNVLICIEPGNAPEYCWSMWRGLSEVG